MKVLLATGVPELDNAIKDRVKRVSFVGSVLYKEAVVDAIERKKPDVIILSELLEGVTPTRELILTLRTQFPETRIIYIFREENLKEKAFLYQWMVWDVFSGSFAPEDLEENLFKPKQFKDVSGEIPALKPYQTQGWGTGGEVDIRDMKNIKGDGTKLGELPSGTSDIFQEVVAFWSVSDQSGRTFSLINTALRLASKPDLKVLVLDFCTENPNTQLHFGFSDPDKNLGAVIEDVENGLELTKENFERYFVVHPVYKNLRILTGNILKMKDRDPKFIYSIYEKLVRLAEETRYSTILVDTNSGVSDDLTVNILKDASKILLHINETPGSLYAVRRCFDTEVGQFVEKLIDKKKITTILNQSNEEKLINFRRALEASTKIPTGVAIPYHKDVLESIYQGKPILSKNPPQEIYNVFVTISNIIHRNLFIPPKPAKKTDKKGKGGSGLFGFGNKTKK